MPIYEYACSDCGHTFEALRSMKDADQPIHCTHCQSKQTHRKLSVFFAQSDGRQVSGTSSGGCGNCSGGSCGSCGCGH